MLVRNSAPHWSSADLLQGGKFLRRKPYALEIAGFRFQLRHAAEYMRRKACYN